MRTPRGNRAGSSDEVGRGAEIVVKGIHFGF